MKKDRNAFFQNQSASTYYYPNNIPMGNPMAANYPIATESSSNFYQGPVISPMVHQQSNLDSYSSELESRLAKIERQINRLDTRISKLESEIPSNFGSSDYSNNNMYMV